MSSMIHRALTRVLLLGRSTQLRIVEALVGALWLLMFDRTGSNIKKLREAGGYEVLADVLHTPSASQQRVQHMVIGCLWTLSVTKEGIGPLIDPDGPPLLERALAVANSKAVGLQVKVFAAGFLVVRLSDVCRDSADTRS